MIGVRLILAYTAILTLNRSAVSASGGNDAHTVDYGTVLKIVETLEKRVVALEVENEQQRLEISELRGLLETQHGHKDTTRVEVKESHDDDPGIGKKNRIQRANPEMTIAFFASLQATVTHLGHGQNIRFEKVVTNVGNAYDSRVGIFRAPFAGVYVFSTTVQTTMRDTTHYGFALNGKPFTILYVNGAESAWDDASQTVVLQLSTGDDVSVQHLDSDMSLNGSNVCVFSGFLLSQNQEGASIVG